MEEQQGDKTDVVSKTTQSVRFCQANNPSLIKANKPKMAVQDPGQPSSLGSES